MSGLEGLDDGHAAAAGRAGLLEGFSPVIALYSVISRMKEGPRNLSDAGHNDSRRESKLCAALM